MALNAASHHQPHQQRSSLDTSVSLNFYLFGHLLPTMSRRERLRSILLYSRVGTAWSLFQMLLTLGACVQYVVATYSIPIPGSQAIDLTISCLFLLDYLLSFYAAPDWRYYPFGFMPIVDLLTIAPAFVELLPGSAGGVNALRLLRVVRSLRILRSFRLISDNLKPSQRALAELFLMCLCSIFIFATVFLLTEVDFYDQITGSPDGSQSDLGWNFGSAVYFGVTLLATVGYGDLYPETFWGKLVTSALIIFTVGTFLSKISQFGSE